MNTAYLESTADCYVCRGCAIAIAKNSAGMDRKAEGLKVSIIVPVYQVADYIERCLMSVIHQTYKNIECIIVDDATQDDSIQKCEKLIGTNEDVDFSIIHHHYHKGLSAARNTGIDAATGDYIFFLDSDDELTTDCIEKLVRPLLLDATIEMVLGNVEYYSDGCPLTRSFKNREKRVEQNINTNVGVRNLFFKKNDFFSEAWNRLIKKKFLLKNSLYFHEGIIMESSLWNFFLVKHLTHLYFIQEVTYLYYRRPNSIMTGIDQKERLYSKEIRCSEIANNLTEGEKGREVRFYLPNICFGILQSPNSEVFTRSAQLFKKALSDDHYWIEEKLLTIVMYLSKTILRGGLFFLAENLRKFINSW